MNLRCGQKKYVEPSSISNAAAQYGEERAQLIKLQYRSLKTKVQLEANKVQQKLGKRKKKKKKNR